jgi:capsular polysaccharide transport system ATP-binding protein
MTLELNHVTKKVRAGSVRVTYQDLNIRIEDGANVAFLGHSEAGIDVIINVLCGADAPDKGKVVRTHSISWPIPATTFMQSHLSLTANARFLARLYEVDERAYLTKIAENGLARFLDTRADEVSGEIKTLFAFVAGVCLPFDCYILNKTAIAKKTYPDLAERLIDDIRQKGGLLLVTAMAKTAEQFCDQAYVFDQGQATFHDDMEAAVEHFNSIESKDRSIEGEETDDADSDLQNMVGVDF